MEFALSEEHQMLKDLVRRFVDDQLIPLEPAVLAREAAGGGTIVTPEERAIIDKKSNELGLWGLDAPTEFGGSGLSTVTMFRGHKGTWKSGTPYTRPPASPNLRM